MWLHEQLHAVARVALHAVARLSQALGHPIFEGRGGNIRVIQVHHEDRIFQSYKNLPVSINV
jgi:hypothetical protein